MNNAERMKWIIENGYSYTPPTTGWVRPKWSLAEFNDEESAIEFARDNGWLENKVQLKELEDSNGNIKYVIEPYEKDCHCPGLIRPY